MNIMIILGFVFVFVMGVLFFLNQSKKESSRRLPIDLEKFIEALGGKSNIIQSDATISKITVQVGDVELINTETITSLGASGVVITNNKVVIIFGKISKEIDEALKLGK